ncbi:hypothetical protein CYMTET_24492 [Cymbomonas tetramitiformis]|uniref:Uncharacterized protein n=1 Tax=Cymbomonas tetramitiformis TaxID=36881 RepID=A0AAE0L082_9CHLO|nr:hypothetical protein CYMTET_24492 [Cymbomonas tetramitiformis]
MAASPSTMAEIDFANFSEGDINLSDVKLPEAKRRKKDVAAEEELVLCPVPYHTFEDQFDGKVKQNQRCGNIACFVNATVRSKDLIPTNNESLRASLSVIDEVPRVDNLITTSFNPGETYRTKYTDIPMVPGGQVICNFGIAMSPTMYKQAVALGKRAAAQAGQKFVDKMQGLPSDPSDPSKTVVLRKLPLVCNGDTVQKLAICGSLRFHWLRAFFKKTFEGRYCESCVAFGEHDVPCMFVDIEDERAVVQIFGKLGYKVKNP